MAQKTVVEWLYEELWKQTDFSLPSNILEKAKEIEKEQNQRLIDEALIAYGFIKNSEITEKNGERTKLKTI
jgi:hypothetical protein